MFPSDITGPVTCYCYYKDSITGNDIYERRILQGCFWNDDSIAVYKQTGTQTSYNITVFIPNNKEITGYQYIVPEEWNKTPYDLLSDKFTLNPKQFPYMYKGECPFIFDWNSASQIRDFTTQYPMARISKDINEQLFGSIDMQHLVVRC